MRHPGYDGLWVCNRSEAFEQRLDEVPIGHRTLPTQGHSLSQAAGELEQGDSSGSEIEVVEVYFVCGEEYDSRTGRPWGMSQAAFDARNDAYQSRKS